MQDIALISVGLIDGILLLALYIIEGRLRDLTHKNTLGYSLKRHWNEGRL